MEYITVSVNIVLGGFIIYNLYYINVNLVELKEIIENIF